MSDTAEIPAAVQRRVLDSLVKKWAAILGLALTVGGVAIPAIAWALEVVRTMDLHEQRLQLLEKGYEDGRAMFRATCVQADEELRAAADLKCPMPYRARRR